MKSLVEHIRKFDKMVHHFDKLVKKNFADQMELINFYIEDHHEPYICLDDEYKDLENLRKS